VAAPAQHTLLFETGCIAAAAPGFVARLGVVYVDSAALGWLAAWRARVAAMDPGLLRVRVPTSGGWARFGDALLALARGVLAPALAFVRAECAAAAAPASDTHPAALLLDLMERLCLAACRRARVARDQASHSAAAEFCRAASAASCAEPAEPAEAGEGDPAAAPVDGACPSPPSLPYKVDTSRPSLRTNWTRLVPLTGAWVAPLFLFAAAWSLGGALDRARRAALDACLQRLARGEEGALHALAADGAATELPLAGALPRAGGLFDALYVVEGAAEGGGVAGRWVAWEDLPGARGGGVACRSLVELVAPTRDFALYTGLLEVLLLQPAAPPLLLTGPAAAGKSFYLAQRRAGLSPLHFATLCTAFTASSLPAHLRSAVAGCLEQRRSGVLAPRGNRRLLAQIEDVNLPRSDASGARPALELLRQALAPPPPFRTKWTRLVHPSVLIGHVSSL
jgi:hypothetical protein